jgi:hypothetical protein
MVCYGSVKCRDTVYKGNFCQKHWFQHECLLPDLRKNPRRFCKQIEEIMGNLEGVKKSAVRIQAHWRRVMVRNRVADPSHPWGKARLEREFSRGF